MWVVSQGTVAAMTKAPRHPEVDQQNATALELDNQILATTLDRRNALAVELGGHDRRVERPHEARIENHRPLDSPTDQDGRELLRTVSTSGSSGIGPAVAPPPRCPRVRRRRRGRSRAGGARRRRSRTRRRPPRSPWRHPPRSRAWTSASTSPRPTPSPRFTRQTTPTAWSTESVFVRRPAPSSSAAMPTASAARRVTTPSRSANHLAYDRGDRQRLGVGVAALRSNPALVGAERGAVGYGGLRATPSFLRVDAEVGERQQPGAAVEHELGEVGRTGSADRVVRPRGSRGVADRRAEGLVHVREQADHLLAGAAARGRASARRGSARRRASS